MYQHSRINGRIEPWGKAASSFVAKILSNAEVIVLEAEENRLSGEA